MNKPQQYSKCNIADGIKMHIPNRLHGQIYFPHVKESGQFLPAVSGVLEIFCLWNPESWAFRSGMQLWESGISLTTGIWNPSPLKGLESSNRNPESTAWNPESMTVFDSLTWGHIYKRGAGL